MKTQFVHVRFDNFEMSRATPVRQIRVLVSLCFRFSSGIRWTSTTRIQQWRQFLQASFAQLSSVRSKEQEVPFETGALLREFHRGGGGDGGSSIKTLPLRVCISFCAQRGSLSGHLNPVCCWCCVRLGTFQAVGRRLQKLHIYLSLCRHDNSFWHWSNWSTQHCFAVTHPDVGNFRDCHSTEGTENEPLSRKDGISFLHIFEPVWQPEKKSSPLSVLALISVIGWKTYPRDFVKSKETKSVFAVFAGQENDRRFQHPTRHSDYGSGGFSNQRHVHWGATLFKTKHVVLHWNHKQLSRIMPKSHSTLSSCLKTDHFNVSHRNWMYLTDWLRRTPASGVGLWIRWATRRSCRSGPYFWRWCRQSSSSSSSSWKRKSPGEQQCLTVPAVLSKMALSFKQEKEQVKQGNHSSKLSVGRRFGTWSLFPSHLKTREQRTL